MTIHQHELEVRTESDMVILEPPPVHSVRGFSVYLTPQQAMKLGHKLIGAGTRALPPTTKMGKE
jgi:hypothetical protein